MLEFLLGIMVENNRDVMYNRINVWINNHIFEMWQESERE